jgi:DNA-binding transcriptional LysR family regulator
MCCADVEATAAEQCKVQGGSYRRGEQTCGSEHQKTVVPPPAALQRGLTFFTGPRSDDESGAQSFTVVPLRTALRAAHLDINYAAALAALGIAGLPRFVIEDAQLENALERVMPEWRRFSVTLWAALPGRKHLPARTRALLVFLIQVFGGEDRDPWLAAAGCETRMP